MKKIDCYEEILRNLSASDIEEVYPTSLDINEQDDLEDYLLNAACRLLQTKNVKFFISKGTNLDSIGTNLDTPLISAIDFYHHNPITSVEIVETLLKSGADIEKRGMFFKTPFIKACTRGCLAIIKILVENGCNIHATVKDLGREDNGLEFAYVMQVDRECINYLEILYKKHNKTLQWKPKQPGSR